MLFQEIIGQEATKDFLRHSFLQGRTPHAQMLIGGASGGALPLAMAFAQWVMCGNRTETESCGKCANCLKISHMEHPDLHFIFPVNDAKASSADKPTSDKYITQWRDIIAITGGYFDRQDWYKKIEIENKQGIIRREEAAEILRKMSLKSFEGGYKIVIIWLPETMQDGAANALLKLIEEPAPGTLFLLVSEDSSLVINTIRSRAQQIIVPKLETTIMAAELSQRFGCQAMQAMEIAHSSDGHWAQAMKIAQGSQLMDNYTLFTELMRMAYQNNFLKLFDWAEGMAAIGREAQRNFCLESIAMLRDCYLIGIGLPQLSYIGGAKLDFGKKFAPFVNHKTVEPFVEEFERLSAELRQNGNPKILFSHFAMTLCKIFASAKK
ncbi:MAG: DNA polymerase III subunit delta [Mucinivorans sp.]